MDLLYIFDSVWINECADPYHDITSAYLLLCEGTGSCAIENQWCILVLIDHHHGHEPVARIRHCGRYRSGIDIEYRRRVERVAVGADYGLLVDWHDLAVVIELTESSVPDGAAKIHVGLCAIEVVWSDGHCHFC